jgi:hypothetical protein
MRDAILANGPPLRYDRARLLTLHLAAVPAVPVQARIRELGLWTVSRLFDLRWRGVAYMRRYRGKRSGRVRPVIPQLRPFGNGAYMLLCDPVRRRSISRSRSRTLIEIRRAPDRMSAQRLSFAVMNVRSALNKVDDLLEIRRDRAIDVFCLVETWHDATQSVSVVCVQMGIELSIDLDHDPQQSLWRCRRIMAAWRSWPCPASPSR